MSAARPNAEDGEFMPDYMYLLESRLSAEQRTALFRMQELAIASEHNIYLVGGAVRDTLMNLPATDFDIEVYGLAPDAL
mgnify:CR=1 FL=1